METNSNCNLESLNIYNLKQELLRGIYAYGFDKPTFIQHKVLTELLSNHDIITQCQSATGKLCLISYTLYRKSISLNIKIFSV